MLHSAPLIGLHWITVVVLAPLGSYFPVFAVLALIGYAAVLAYIMFSRSKTVRAAQVPADPQEA